MFVDLFYKLGASIVIVLGIIVLKTSIGENWSLRKEDALLMLTGCVTSVFFHVSKHFHYGNLIIPQ